MITISQDALANMEQQLAAEGGPASAIRIAIMGGTGPAGLGLLVDSPTDSDQCFQHGAIPVIIDRRLLEYCRNISIDFVSGQGSGCSGKQGSGYLISADNPINF